MAGLRTRSINVLLWPPVMRDCLQLNFQRRHDCGIPSVGRIEGATVIVIWPPRNWASMCVPKVVIAIWARLIGL